MFSRGSEPQQILRVGTISSVDKKRCTAKVVFEDQDETVSHDLRIVVPQTMKTKHYWIPDIDEQVLCAFLQNGIETGFIIGAIYSEIPPDTPPVEDENIKGVWFEDGTFIRYDTKSSVMTIKATNPIKIIGDIHVQGTIYSDGGNG